jgi:hypothetical protein
MVREPGVVAVHLLVLAKPVKKHGLRVPVHLQVVTSAIGAGDPV